VSVGLIAGIVWFLRPQLPENDRAFSALWQVSAPLLVVALVLEALSRVCYSAVSALIFATVRVSFPTLLRIDLVATGLSHAAPAGGATATALRIELLHQAGVRRADALSGAAVQATAGNLVLGGIFLLGVVLWIGGGGARGAYAVASGIVVALMLVVVALVWATATRGERMAARWRATSWEAPAFRPRVAVAAVAQSMATRLRDLREHPGRTGRVLGLAALTWLLDASVLWVMIEAVGADLAPGPLLIVYGMGNLLAVVPLTPGGLGMVEGSMIPALLGFGISGGPALVAVIGWRFWQFWLPILVGGPCYLSLTIGRRRGSGRSPRSRAPRPSLR
jgi:uncharacterized protein (TIRG00374 family)